MNIKFSGNTQEIIIKFEQGNKSDERRYPYFVYTREAGRQEADVPGNKLTGVFEQIEKMDALSLAKKINKAGGLVLNENYEVI